MKPKKIPEKEAKSGELQKAKQRIRKLEKEVARLKSEKKTLESYKDLTNEYIGGKLDGVPVEKVIRGVQKQQRLSKINEEPDIREACPKCISSELKIVTYPGGKVKLCRKCQFREVIKENTDGEEDGAE